MKNMSSTSVYFIWRQGATKQTKQGKSILASVYYFCEIINCDTMNIRRQIHDKHNISPIPYKTP